MFTKGAVGAGVASATLAAVAAGRLAAKRGRGARVMARGWDVEVKLSKNQFSEVYEFA